jgi:catechol 2,3-dioxygenase-like lactoylglutathione lyase family enzyme
MVALHGRPDVSICANCLGWLRDKSEKKIAAGGDGNRILGAEPIFTVSDVAAARAHYELLGFRTEEHDETYAFAHRNELTMHLVAPEEDDDVVGGGGAVYVHVDDADDLAEQWRKAGLSVIGPDDMDYGKREGSHVDPDGNLIRFGSPIRS